MDINTGVIWRHPEDTSGVQSMLENTLTAIPVAGVGSRLQPLTRDCAKPSVAFGGKNRIIDFRWYCYEAQGLPV